MFISPRRCTACGESGGHVAGCSFILAMLQSQQQGAFDHAKEVSAAPKCCYSCGEYGGGHLTNCRAVERAEERLRQAACDHSKHDRIHSLEDRPDGAAPDYGMCAGCRARLYE